jgi:hypothetical protein
VGAVGYAAAVVVVLMGVSNSNEVGLVDGVEAGRHCWQDQMGDGSD